MKQIVVTMPYEAEGPGMSLEPGDEKADIYDALESLMWLRDSGPFDDDDHARVFLEGEIERVITSAAGLFALRAGSIAACIKTAVVWERG